jgi:hypothetical protein
MGLTKDTHFRHSAVALLRLDHFEEYLGECPTGLFNELTQLAVEYNDRNPPDSDQPRDEDDETE